MFEQKCLCGKVLYQVEDASTLKPTIQCRHCGRVRKVKYHPDNAPKPKTKKSGRKAKER